MRRCASITLSLLISTAGFPFKALANDGVDMQAAYSALQARAGNCRSQQECAAKNEALAAVGKAAESGRQLNPREQELVARAFPREYFGGKTTQDTMEAAQSADASYGQDEPYKAAIIDWGIAIGLINTAFGSWFMINSGKPDTTAENTNFANAIPSGASWEQLTGGRKASYLRSFTHKNMLGIPVRIQYVVEYKYNLKHNGKGSYLTNVTAYAVHKNIWWGYSVNMSVSIGNPERESGPGGATVAVLPLVVNTVVKTVPKTFSYATVYSVYGNGRLRACETNENGKSCSDISSSVSNSDN
ncbi:MAG: hypothetical protein WC421_02240 [Elusimicrobiales bacterium]